MLSWLGMGDFIFLGAKFLIVAKILGKIIENLSIKLAKYTKFSKFSLKIATFLHMIQVAKFNMDF
jgi:hypothetical protein